MKIREHPWRTLVRTNLTLFNRDRLMDTIWFSNFYYCNRLKHPNQFLNEQIKKWVTKPHKIQPKRISRFLFIFIRIYVIFCLSFCCQRLVLFIIFSTRKKIFICLYVYMFVHKATRRHPLIIITIVTLK